jgi:hypothetical protein
MGLNISTGFFDNQLRIFGGLGLVAAQELVQVGVSRLGEGPSNALVCKID